MPQQGDLFAGAGTTGAERIDLPGADVVHLPHFFGPSDADRLLAALDETVIWRQDTITMFGSRTPVPRLTAWYGDPERSYTYSGIAMDPTPWSEPLLEIKARVEDETDERFTSVLANLYRTGQDSVAWHADDEAELGPRPTIASVSFGGTRRFQLRRRDDHDVKHAVDLDHGSVLIMRGRTQALFEHQVPKTKRAVEPRINLTFRHID